MVPLDNSPFFKLVKKPNFAGLLLCPWWSLAVELYHQSVAPTQKVTIILISFRKDQFAIS